MKVWITKYALTRGIYTEEDAAVCESIDVNRICVTKKRYVNPVVYYNIYYHKPDWHDNENDAIARAEFLREKKVESLKNVLRKFEAMTFTPSQK